MELKAAFAPDIYTYFDDQAPASLFYARTGEFPSKHRMTLFCSLEDAREILKNYKVLNEQSYVSENFKIISEDILLEVSNNILITVNSPSGDDELSVRRKKKFPYEEYEDYEEGGFNFKGPYCKVSIMYSAITLSELIQMAFFKELEKKMEIPESLKKELDPYAHIITVKMQKFHLTEFTVQKTEMDVALNYGAEFAILHDYIDKNITDEKRKKGLYLFHGVPGTGKSSYIRFLIGHICKLKRVIYLPPDFASSLTDPNFITFLLDYPNSVLIIEDAENILRSRDGATNQAVANLLNLSDGLLADLLQIQLICTFNCEIKEIDSALLRKGRLVAKHEFKELEINQAQDLINSIGLDLVVKEKMTLADIYNISDMSFQKKKINKIGY